MGGGRLLATRFVRMAADGVEAEGDIISRISFLDIPSSFPSFHLLSFSLRLFTRMKRLHLTKQSLSLSLRHLLFSSAGYGMLPPLRALSGPFYLDAVFSPFPAASMHSRDTPWRGDTGANMI